MSSMARYESWLLQQKTKAPIGLLVNRPEEVGLY